MPSNNNTITHSRTSPYYERTGTISPTMASLLHISPGHNGSGHMPHIILSHPTQPSGVHKMNGNLSRNMNSMRFSNAGGSPTKISPILTKNPNISLNSTAKQPLLDISRTSANFHTSHQNGSRIGPHSPKASVSNDNNSETIDCDCGLHEMLASLALMCLLSLLMAFLALFFLQRTCHLNALTDDSNTESNPKVNRNINHRIVSNTKEYIRIFQISVSLSTLTISLDLCCLFVCCIQFLSAVKLLKTPFGKKRTFEFLKKTSHIRVAAIGAFLISIPIFFTGVILFTFVNFDETPALATSVVIGIGIIFCGIASVQSVYLWQWEKTKASQELSKSRIIQLRDSGYLPTIELSTLV